MDFQLNPQTNRYEHPETGVTIDGEDMPPELITPKRNAFDEIIDWTLHAEPPAHGPVRHRRG